jgi:V8-like Glu-specific endopeptidase
MKFKSLIFALTTASLFTSISGLADQNNPSVLSKQNDAMSNNTTTYWTPERLRDAKELTMPLVDPSKIQKSAVNPNAQGGAVNGGDGQPPTINISANTQPLFKPIIQSNDHSTSPMDSGTQNEQFSSTQLVPLSADLSYPYRAVGKLFFTIPGRGDYVCSASVIKPRIIVTAGHCVHSGSGGSDGFYTNWLFIPAFRDGSAPFQSWSWSYANVSNTWATGGGIVPNASDFAMIEMKDQAINGATQKIGAVTGYLGWQSQSLIPNHANLLGYPCNFDSCQKMHQVTAQSAAAVSPNNVEYGSDMGGGSSGGPWVQNFGKYSVGQTGGNNPGLNRVVAVTSWGYTNPAYKAQGASNFNDEFINLLNTMCSHQAGNC